MAQGHKITFIITEENREQLEEIQRKFGLAKSDSVRRSIEMLHDYLIKDKQPKESTAGSVEKQEETTG